MKTSRIIAIAALVAILILAMGLVTACGPTPAPTTAAPTAVPPAPTKAPAVEPTKAPPAPTVAPPAPTAPAKPTAAAVAPVAKISIVAVPGYVSDPHAITATITYVTDTAVAKPASATAALYTSGLGNVPINVPVQVVATVADPKNSGKATFTLSKPAASKATITNTKDLDGKFTPDVPGTYLVGATVKNAAGLSSVASYVKVTAGTYIGATAGKCVTCHAKYTEEWAKTAHATLFSRELDNKVDGAAGVKPSAAGYITHYSESCVRCHATGYYPAPYNGSGGYWDAKAAAKWTFPTWKLIDGAFTKANPSNWDAAPAGVKNMGNIGCEVCHGPASEHVKNGAKTQQASFDSGVCGQCHGAAANHSKSWQLANSKHSTGTSFEEINGPSRQACMRCHGAEGFATFVANPKDQSAWSYEEGSISCAACHDPHSEENAFQLRVVGKPVEIPFQLTKDVGLSAICYTCHNGRVNAADAEKGSTPHYSTAAELLSDTGGVTYGATIPNSPHGMMVGAAPVSTGATEPGAAKFKWTPADAKAGNVPGSCVACHMWDPITSPMTDTRAFKVGGHSFNVVTPDGKTDYGASCKACHGDVKDFNLKAKADYDGNGKIEGVQDEVKGLINVLFKALEAKGVKQSAGHPYATLPKDAAGKTDLKIVNAWFNLRVVYGPMWSAGADGKVVPGGEGKAAAIHNMKRTVALLQLSLKDLTGSLPAGMADGTK